MPFDAERGGPPLIVGIGASAGGLEAFTAFFANMPNNSGMAFVLIQHLSPTHDSMLVPLLGRTTEMKVTEAADGMAVAADCVFIIPPDATLTIERGILRLTKPAPPRDHRRPIDSFFCSLAEDQGENSVCIVLSGTGTDGTIGLKTVKEHGGLTMAQAEFDSMALSGMPRSASDTGLVDYVMPVGEMPAKLIEYRQHLIGVRHRKGRDGTRQDTVHHLEKICALLRNRLGHDFSQYKDTMLLRRIQRRMQVLQIDGVQDYIARLGEESRQIDLLFRDLLIGVTHFFRDAQAFEAVAKLVVPKLIEGRHARDTIRVWVPGCSTGEEPYSIAILLREAMETRGLSTNIQIFATDIDDHAVQIARASRYRTVQGVSPERLERWFVEDSGSYRPTKAIREMCVFSTHSIIKDPPFSRLDLISCRNVMIYMRTELQDRVIRTFHYALKPGGHLFLGPSETVTRNSRLFSEVDKRHRIFVRRSDVAASQLAHPFSSPKVKEPDPVEARAPGAEEDDIERDVRRVMDRYVPAHVVIDRNNTIVRFSRRTGKYLDPSAGIASLNLFGVLHLSLRAATKTAVLKAFAGRKRVVHQNLTVQDNGGIRLIDLIVEPIPEHDGEPSFLVVAFREAESHDDRRKRDVRSAIDDGEPSGVAKLRNELAATRMQLLSATEEMERANEDLRSINEEFQSVNEELQSSNEELETSQEEQQSFNEELQTMNAELSSANETLAKVNSDLKNLLDSTEIATIFLDRDLRIKNFTPAIRGIFHLQDGDRGRPVTDIATRLNYGDLQSDVKTVLRTLSVIERELSVPGDGQFLMRIRPYRTIDDAIDGVVTTFVDITVQKRQGEENARLAAIVEASGDAIIGHSLDGTITSWNSGAQKVFGYSPEKAVGRPFSILFTKDDADKMREILVSLRRGGPAAVFDAEAVHSDGSTVHTSLIVSPIRDIAGRTITASTIARDIGDRHDVETHRDFLIAEMDHRVKNMLAVVTSLATQTLRSCPTREEFVTAFLGRIKSLSLAQQLLTNTNPTGIPLATIIREELALLGGDQTNITISGDENVLLTPKATVSMTIAVHELATNALKYGALSQSGRVAVRWSVTSGGENPTVTFEWIESGGPTVSPPTRRGFGSELIERGLTYELEAVVRREFPPEGARCTIEFPLTGQNGSLRTDDGKGGSSL